MRKIQCNEDQHCSCNAKALCDEKKPQLHAFALLIELKHLWEVLTFAISTQVQFCAEMQNWDETWRHEDMKHWSSRKWRPKTLIVHSSSFTPTRLRWIKNGSFPATAQRSSALIFHHCWKKKQKRSESNAVTSFSDIVSAAPAERRANCRCNVAGRDKELLTTRLTSLFALMPMLLNEGRARRSSGALCNLIYYRLIPVSLQIKNLEFQGISPVASQQ